MFNKLISPRFPTAAVGLESGNASVVHLERRGNVFAVKRAATITLASELLRPNFDEVNIQDSAALGDTLAELVTSAGMQRQKRWTVGLPEASTRTMILTLESATGSRSELEEVLRWKTERSFGHPHDELRVGRERLTPDAQGRARYLATAIRESVLAEYESVFESLGWRAGLILPRHIGEGCWLARNNFRGDSLLLSSHAEGFTAVLMRQAQPLIVRSVMCEAEDRDDELFRLLLFYRDRLVPADVNNLDAPLQSLERLLVVGDGFNKERVNEIINETLGSDIHALDAKAVGLSLPSADLSFDSIAAPAGLATLAW